MTSELAQIFGFYEPFRKKPGASFGRLFAAARIVFTQRSRNIWSKSKSPAALLSGRRVTRRSRSLRAQASRNIARG